MGRHVHVLRRPGTPIDIFMDKKYIAVKSGLEYGNYKQQIKRERLKLNTE